MKKSAFTMIELVFVIVIMGILSVFGVEIVRQIYNSYIGVKIYNDLEFKSTTTIEQISNRLQNRIKDSTIVRDTTDSNHSGNFNSIQNSSGSENMIEWIGVDREGFNGTWNGSWNQPTWSAFIDVNDGNTTTLHSNGSDTTKIDSMIDSLSSGSTTISDSAIFFIGANSDIFSDYGYDGVAITDQSRATHPIKAGSSLDLFEPDGGDFSGIDIYEFYQLAWSAYAIKHSDGNLTLYYNYQPWEGEKYSDGSSATLMENVDSFRVQAIGEMIKLQLCVQSDLISTYSLCKEKAIF
ncbi:MAG: prepilin-type N-terminal cleavage/methylation domain-containing protein [Helicobacteraceae bacterium]|nr:prepilin-type N-terminal cleavage/methylation domain-containing protein [Helicobacteraceae bacterium]